MSGWTTCYLMKQGMKMPDERKCPLCGSKRTSFTMTFGDPECDDEVDSHENPFESQECTNRKCGLSCRLWDTVEWLQRERDEATKEVKQLQTLLAEVATNGISLEFAKSKGNDQYGYWAFRRRNYFGRSGPGKTPLEAALMLYGREESEEGKPDA